MKLKVDPYWLRHVRRSSRLERWAARTVARMLLEAPAATWQAFGEEWSNFKDGKQVKPATGCIFVRNASTAQYILRQAGYGVCEADLMRQCGIDLSRKPRDEHDK